MITKNIHKIIWAIISISLLIHFLGLVAQQTILQGWQWEHHPVHASVEISGAIIALLVAGLLLSLERQNKGTNFNIWIAGGLTAMGLLDGFHALTHSGNTFVWLHSTATFVGGILFALVWLPHRWERLISACWIPTIIVITVFLALSSMLFPDALPVMVLEKKFTIQAKGLNILGGLCLFGASVRLFVTYFSNHNVDNLLFCLHCLLFGSAAIMFEQSELWDIAWWGWHVLRLMAYGIAFWFVILTIQQSQQDITKTIKQLNFELDKELEAFAYSVSHDLRGPLRAIDGFTGILMEEHADQLDAEGQRLFGVVRENTSLMAQLIEDMLEFSRIGRSAMEPARIDMPKVVAAAVQQVQQQQADRELPIKVHDLPPAMGDERLIQQVWINLLSNAAKFTAQRESPAIEVRGVVENNEQVYSVKDNGAGFDMKHSGKLFSLFQRLHAPGEFEGTGIGLAIVKRIVERHGGRIWAEGKVNEGATFYFALPSEGGT